MGVGFLGPVERMSEIKAPVENERARIIPTLLI